MVTALVVLPTASSGSVMSRTLAGDTTEPERAEPEPATPAETAPVTGATAIREALATARAALSIIEANL